MALDLSDLTHSFAVAGIWRLKPELTLEQAQEEPAKRLYLSASPQ